VIRFIAEREGLDFAGAVAHLVGHHDPTGTISQPAAPERAARPFDAAQWSRNMAYTMSRLTPDTPQGRYLLGRRLHPATWAAFHLGAGYAKLDGARYDAIAIPWHDQAGGLVAVNHRLLNPPDPKRRYHVVGNHWGHLWGWGSHRGDQQTLFVVEGELNAMAIWQALGVDVLSVGSQNQTITPDQAEQIRQWDQVVLWADLPDVAEKWRGVIGAGDVVQSDRDANDLLIAGEL
jgi:DNA primase